MRKAVAVASALVAILAVLLDSRMGRDEEAAQLIDVLANTAAPAPGASGMPGIDGCVKEGETDSTCLQSWLVSGVSVLGVKDTLREFDEFLQAFPGAIKNCHEPSHALGSAVWESRGSMSVQDLFSLGGETCLMGYVHGILETLASENPSADTLVSVFQACDAAYAAGSGVQMCYDGIGHAAWSAYKDLEEAVKVCGRAADGMSRRSCETGIVMQVFKPAHLEPSVALSEDLSEAVDMCRRWPELATLDGSHHARGCWDGVAYLIHEKLSTQWFKEGALPVKDDSEMWVARFKKESSACGALEEGAALCFQNLGRYVMLPWTGLDWEVAEAMCMTNTSMATGCLWEAANSGIIHGAIKSTSIKDYLESEGHNVDGFVWKP